MKKIIAYILHRYFPELWYYVLYYRAAQKIGDASSARKDLFSGLIARSFDKKCLQIGVRGEKHAPHFISVDLHDRSDYIDYNYDIHDLKFSDNSFDIVVCNAILEHIEDPLKSLSELHRVLKKDGEIWIGVPFNQPYHPHPNDYWRVSLDGLRIWMKDFTEISAGFFKINKSSIYNGVFFYGRK
jgi:SAM-dependent methyltransferase